MAKTKNYIRAARLADWQFVRELNHQLFLFEKENCEESWNVLYPFSSKARKYYIDACNGENDHHCFVYIGDDYSIDGYGILKHLPSDDQLHRQHVILYQIDTLCVRDGQRNNGIGRKLIQHMVNFAKGNGATHVKLNVLTANKRAFHLYKSCGFDEFEISLEKKL